VGHGEGHILAAAFMGNRPQPSCVILQRLPRS